MAKIVEDIQGREIESDVVVKLGLRAVSLLADATDVFWDHRDEFTDKERDEVLGEVNDFFEDWFVKTQQKEPNV